MKHVLIVDDEETLLLIIETRFEDYKDQFKVLTASNGKEAIRILESNVIDFVVTDLNMPILDGIELLAYMSANFPTIPAIAMTAFSTPEVEGRLKKMGTLRILDKPINLDMLAHTVLKGLARAHQGGNLTSVSVSNFIQLIHMEEKTCVVEVHNEDKRRGFLYFNRGELYDATLDSEVGETACYKMVAWDNVQLYLKDHPKKSVRKRINQGVMSLVLEGLRLKDEAAARKGQKPSEPEASAALPYESAAEHSDPGGQQSVEKSAHSDPTPQVEFIGRIFRVINSNSRDEALLPAVLKEIQAIVDFDLAAMMIREKSRQGCLKVADLMSREKTRISRGAYFSYEGTIFAKALKIKKPMLVDKPGSLTQKVEKLFFAGRKYRSCLLVPLMTGGIAKGLLVLAAKKPDMFSAEQSLTRWIADGISCVNVHNSLAAEIEKVNQALDATRQIGRALVTSTFNIERVLEFGMDTIEKIMNVEAGSLMLRNQEELKVAHYFNRKVKTVKKFRLKIGQGIAGHVAARGRAVIVNDAKKSSRFFSGIDKQTGFKTRSVLCVPMVSKQKVSGVIQVLNKIDGDFTSGDQDCLQSIADSLCTAMEAALLYRQAVKTAEDEQSVSKTLQGFLAREGQK
jgi:transcriptional regulator with GAF, ATPase, and Fis domain/DNA-binding response OmpR family regulator